MSGPPWVCVVSGNLFPAGQDHQEQTTCPPGASRGPERHPLPSQKSKRGGEKSCQKLSFPPEKLKALWTSVWPSGSTSGAMCYKQAGTAGPELGPPHSAAKVVPRGSEGPAGEGGQHSQQMHTSLVGLGPTSAGSTSSWPSSHQGQPASPPASSTPGSSWDEGREGEEAGLFLQLRMDTAVLTLSVKRDRAIASFRGEKNAGREDTLFLSETGDS